MTVATGRFEIADVKAAARGQWPAILSAAGIDGDLLDGRHHSCPKCGGSDRFRMIDDAAGAVLCGQCFREGNGDGLAAVMWIRSCKFPDALRFVAECVGLAPKSGQPNGKPVDSLELLCQQKRMARASAIAYGARAENGCVTFPSWSVGGERLSDFRMRPDGSEKERKGLWPKDGQAGVFLPVNEDGSPRLPVAGETWIVVEGCKDAAALHSRGYLALGLPTSQLSQRFVRLLLGVDVVLVPDRDTAGINGADKTARRLYGVAASIRIAALPGEVKESGGVDTRDILAKEDGERLVRLAIDEALPFSLGSEEVETAQPMIDAAEVVEHVSTTVDIPPANEAQARPLTRLPADEQPRAVPNKITYARITAAELAITKYSIEFLIEGAMVASQPLIVAGGKKTLKTGLLCDAAISLARGNKFLGTMDVLRAARVLFMSGESGLATLQETCIRICREKGFELQDVPGLIFSPDLPRIDDMHHHAALEEMIVADEIEVLIVDPVYLCLGGDDAGNLFKQGTTLRAFNSLCQANGVTLILCHHTRKGVADPFKPPELEDIAWAGFQEYARQWWLLGRRQRYEPGSGDHKLWLNIGGSAGHSALWAMDIAEGKLGQEGGRTWGVSLTTANEARQEAEQLAESAKQEARERKHSAKLDDATTRVRDALRGLPGNEGTVRSIRDRAGIKGAVLDEAIAKLIRMGRLEQIELKKGNKQTYEGYRYVFGTPDE